MTPRSSGSGSTTAPMSFSVRRAAVFVALALVVGSGSTGATAAGPVLTSALDDCHILPPLGAIEDRCETWVSIYDDAERYEDGTFTHADDNFLKMAVSPTGDRLFTLGATDQYPNIGATDAVGSFAVAATRSPSGDELWVVRRPASEVTLFDIAVSSDGEIVYVAGGQTVGQRPGDSDPLLNESPYLAAYRAATGEFLWERRLDGAYVGHIGDQPYDLHSGDQGRAVVARDGVVYVTGYLDGLHTYYDVLLAAFDERSGAHLWSSTFDGSTSELPFRSDEALLRLVQISPAGDTVYVPATSCPPNNPHAAPPPAAVCPHLVVAFDAHDAGAGRGGQVRWSALFGASTVTSLDVGPDGTVYVSDANQTRAYSRDSGELLWSAPVGGSVVVPADGTSVFVARSDYTLVTLDPASGTQLRSTPHLGLPSDRAVAMSIAIAPEGDRVYVTGTTGILPSPQGRVPRAYEPAEPGALTVAYATGTGARIWIARYGRDLDMEEARQVEVGPDGAVFVATDLRKPEYQSQLPGNDGDWGVLSYEP